MTSLHKFREILYRRFIRLGECFRFAQVSIPLRYSRNDGGYQYPKISSVVKRLMVPILPIASMSSSFSSPRMT